MPPVDAAPASSDETNNTANGSGESGEGEEEEEEEEGEKEGEEKDESSTSQEEGDGGWLGLGNVFKKAKDGVNWAADVAASVTADYADAVTSSALFDNWSGTFSKAADWTTDMLDWGFSDAQSLLAQNKAEGTTKTAYEGTDNQGRPVSLETQPGQVTHHGGNGETTTVTGDTIHAENGDGVTYDKDKRTGLERELGPGWQFEETEDGNRLITRADGTKMEYGRDEQGRPWGEITYPDGSTQKVERWRTVREFFNGVRVQQRRGGQQDGEEPQSEADRRREEGEQGVVAGVENEGETGVVRVNVGDTTVFAHQDGRKVIQLADGNSIRVQPGGDYQILDSNGELVNSELVTMGEDGALTIRDHNNPDKTVTVQLQGEQAGVVTTNEGVVVAGQGNTVTVQNANGDGTMAVVETDKDGSSTNTEVACQPEGCQLNPDGTPKKDSDGDIEGAEETRVTSVNATTGQVVTTPGDPDDPNNRPDFQTDAEDPNHWIFDAGKDALGKVFDILWGDEEDGSEDRTTTPSLTEYIGNVWDNITNLWDDFAKITSDAIDFLADGLSIDNDLNIFHDDYFIGSAYDDADTGSASSVTSSATTAIAAAAGVSVDDITPGHVSALRSSISDLDREISKLTLAAMRGDPEAQAAIAELNAVKNNALAQLSRAEQAQSTRAELVAKVGNPTGDQIAFYYNNQAALHQMRPGQQAQLGYGQDLDEDLMKRIDKLTA